MSVANTRMTIGAVLATVATTANTVTSTFDAVNKAIGMGNTAVSAAASRQKLRVAIDEHTYKTTLIREKAQEETEAKLKVVEFCAQSADHAELFKSSFDELMAVIA